MTRKSAFATHSVHFDKHEKSHLTQSIVYTNEAISLVAMRSKSILIGPRKSGHCQTWLERRYSWLWAVASYTLLAAVPWKGLENTHRKARLRVFKSFKSDVFIPDINHCVTSYSETGKSLIFAAYKLLCYHRRNLFVCVSRIARPSGKIWVRLYEGGVRYGGHCCFQYM